MKRLRLLLADDHDIVIEGLRRVLDHPNLEDCRYCQQRALSASRSKTVPARHHHC